MTESEPARREGSQEGGARRAVRLVVSGRVQGVGFRAFVMHVAGECDVVGWVRNMPSGDVEIWAEGSTGSLDRMVDTVRRGPRHAAVSNLTEEDVSATGAHARFETRF